MATVKLKGTVNKITEAKKVSDKFTFRELWLNLSDEKFPQTVSIQFGNDKMDLLINLSSGELVEVSANIRGRIYNDKCFNSLDGWSIILESTKSNDDDLLF